MSGKRIVTCPGGIYRYCLRRVPLEVFPQPTHLRVGSVQTGFQWTNLRRVQSRPEESAVRARAVGLQDKPDVVLAWAAEKPISLNPNAVLR